VSEARPRAPIALRCPACDAEIWWSGQRSGPLSCRARHAYDLDDDVLRLLAPPERARLDAFTREVRAFRDAEGLSRRFTDFDALPESAANDPEWRERSVDLRFVRAVAASLRAPSRSRSSPAEPLRVLDIGSANGWLSARLAADGHDVLALDLFDDDDFGLGTRRRYSARWRAMQVDVCRPDRFMGAFDLVVMNHGVHYLPEPTALLERWRLRVAPGGAMVALGLRIYRDASARRRQLAALEARGRSHGITLFPRPGPGLLHQDDARALRRSGFVLHLALDCVGGNLRALISARSPSLYRGLYRAPG
jgi:2-polyprenyl-3-methyl-5-hydroxy-6-metoxy-1,4-benzoquinol methylase